MSPMSAFPNINSNLPRGPIEQGDDRLWPDQIDHGFRRKLRTAKMALTCLMLMTAVTCGFAQDGGETPKPVVETTEVRAMA
ncbi:MAG: hypothetical protein VX834_13600 [Myxococcota bacterium]|nr:hypothetical protein [Myxococcota bacterium]